MPLDKHALIGQVKAVELEHAALAFSTENVRRGVGEGKIGLPPALKRADIDRASDGLEGTYIIRLFTAFEVALKAILRERKVPKMPVGAKALIDRAASLARLSGPILDNAHAARLYRNRLAHQLVHGVPEDERVPIRAVTSQLCTYLSRAIR